MIRDMLKSIAEQVLEGKKLHEINFGEPNLNLEEKLTTIEEAIKRYPSPGQSGPAK
jgi:hypothetical protein